MMTFYNQVLLSKHGGGVKLWWAQHEKHNVKKSPGREPVVVVMQNTSACMPMYIHLKHAMDAAWELMTSSWPSLTLALITRTQTYRVTSGLTTERSQTTAWTMTTTALW